VLPPQAPVATPSLAMNSKRSAQLLVILSIVYGGTVAVLGLLNSPAIAIVALVGALIVGGLWAVRGVLSRR
jgi:hypothetical protein